MEKLLVVYNMAGIRGNESQHYYTVAINSILNQTFKDYRLLLSGCCMPARTKKALADTFGNRIDYNYTEDIYPVPVTFNQSCLEAIKHRGRFEGYVYIDSGCVFTQSDALQKFYNGFKSHGDTGMYASQVDEDNGYFLWYNVGKYTDDHSEDHKLFAKGDFKIPVGKCVNLHTQIFADELVQFYGRPYTDIFAGHCSESVFQFMCAALKKNFYVCKDVMLHHERLDGQSSGFDPYKWRITPGNLSFDHPYRVKSVLERVASPDGYKLGMGFAEVSTPDHPNGVLNHDPAQYDENGYCKNDELKHYIKENLYLNKAELDYDSIVSTYI